MGCTDRLGQTVTLSEPASVADWDLTVEAFLAHSCRTPEHLGRVLEADRTFALGWAAKGLFYLLLGRSELIPTAAEAHRNARQALEIAGGTPRERAYVEALGHYLAGRPSRAAVRLRALMDQHPGDALAMKLDHSIRFVLGDRRGMASSIGAVIEAYDDAHPFAGYALGCQAFALEESGHFAEAEHAGRRGLELTPSDAWGLHAVAHVYDMTGRAEEGLGWLSDRQDCWSHCNNFGYHVWWHLGLFHLDRGEHDAVLALYDERVRAEKTDDYRDISNAASLLQRLEIEGVHVGARWEELAELSAGRVEDGAVVFADLHYLLALGAEARPEAEAMIARLARDAARADHDMHEVAAVAGLPCAVGLAAFRAGQFDLAFEKLRAVRPNLQRVGGSHAQRDVFSRLMIEAGMRARRWDDAEAELKSRARRRGAEDGFTALRLAAIARARAAESAAA